MKDKPCVYALRKHHRRPTSARSPSRSVRYRAIQASPIRMDQPANDPVLELIHPGRLEDGRDHRLIAAIDPATHLPVQVKRELLGMDSAIESNAAPTDSAAT